MSGYSIYRCNGCGCIAEIEEADEELRKGYIYHCPYCDGDFSVVVKFER